MGGFLTIRDNSILAQKWRIRKWKMKWTLGLCKGFTGIGGFPKLGVPFLRGWFLEEAFLFIGVYIGVPLFWGNYRMSWSLNS